MKIRIKQYQNRLKLKLIENIFFFRKKSSNKWKKIVDYGHQKFTIMFIPHNEKNIFNFQISKFTILFFVFLFVGVISVSVYASYSKNEVKAKEKTLLTSYESIQHQLSEFEELTSELSDIIEDIKPDIENLYELTAGPDEAEKLWKIFNKKVKSNSTSKEIRILQNVQNDLLNTTKTANTIANFLKIRESVTEETPSIIPNHGHITSLFGWRRSPFGYGRDFHTGIDIAAPSGTVIKATAPGVVVSAGLAGGYGKRISIKHKYGYQTIYAHCSKIAVKKGMQIRKGQTIGYVGMTGNSTGNHCHYEIRLGGNPINPYPYMSSAW